MTQDQRLVIGVFFDVAKLPQTLSAAAVAEALGRTRQAVRFSLKRLEAAEVLIRSRKEGSREDLFTPTRKAYEIVFGFREGVFVS